MFVNIREHISFEKASILPQTLLAPNICQVILQILVLLLVVVVIILKVNNLSKAYSGGAPG